MKRILGIRREDKNEWERRTPLIPNHIKKLYDCYNIQSIIQPSSIRVFQDDDYKNANATISDDLSLCSVIFAVKEIPVDLFENLKTYIFFSHVIKGQEYNLPMLQEMMNKNCTLIDYEKIVNEDNSRLIFFGKYAGIAGMVDTLYSFGKRLKLKEKIDTPFLDLKKTYQFSDIESLKKEIRKIGGRIQSEGLPKEISPCIVGFAGYGNVSLGAQEIIKLLPTVEITPSQLKSIEDTSSKNCIYTVVFKEKDMVKPIEHVHQFNLQEYYDHPERYESKFEQYLSKLTILMNCIYWDERYPRLVTKQYLSKHFNQHNFNLRIIGDISVDINGAIEATGKVTTPDHPSFIYNPLNDKMVDDFTSDGIAIMSVDNLPCELPKDSSKEFSQALYPFVPDIMNADYSSSFKELNLPDEIKGAVILHKGELTPSYEYINKYL